MSERAFKQNHESPAPPPVRALYVHVPFCRSKCRYCDFYSCIYDDQAAEVFVSAAAAELEARKSLLTLPLESVFIGGGTPTVLGLRLGGELLAMLAPLTNEHTEFSIEANPGTLDERLVETIAAAGVNRVSFGVQSFDDGELKLLGRLHTSDQARHAVELVCSAGIANISIDLMYGIPDQSVDSWQASLASGLELPLTHLSCYGLSFESGTPLQADMAAGRVQPMSDELQRECYYTAIDASEAAGLMHYEISNFAGEGFQCGHNLTYWRNQPYLGIGPGAASYIDGARATTLPSLDEYSQKLLSGNSPSQDSERLAAKAALAETLMLGLRLTDGVDLEALGQRFGLDVVETFSRTLTRHSDLGTVVVTDKRIFIPRPWLFTSDSLLADLIAEAGD